MLSLLCKQAQSDDDEAGETVALNMAASGDKFMEEFFEQVQLCADLLFVFQTCVDTEFTDNSSIKSCWLK